MPKLLSVTREELGFYLRQWTFYLTALGMPLGFIALGALPRLQNIAEETPLSSVETILSEPEEPTTPIGYVDQAGVLAALPDPPSEPFVPYAGEEEAAAALEQGEIESYYVIDSQYIQTGKVVQYSNSPQLLAETDAAVRNLLHEALLHSLGDPELASRLNRSVVLTRRGPPPPQFFFIPGDVDLSQLASAGLIAGLFAYLISVGGNLLLRALHREVRARVLEMMVVSTTPEQFIGGKLLALAGLTLGQALLALGGAALVYGQNPDGSGPAALPLPVLLLSFPYLLLGFLAYSGAIMGIAAVWPTFRESGPLLMVMRLLVLSPLIGALFIVPDANGPLAITLTLLPLTAPLLMPFRLVLASIPAWQWALGFSMLLLWALGWIWLSMRLFRAQGLLTGRTITIGALRQALTG